MAWYERGRLCYVTLFTIAFWKVFDSVSQAIIFNKLKEVSINPYIIYWIIFFPRRLQRLVSNGTMASFWSIIWGVPQGTILGPVYLNWVVRHWSGQQHEVYADDLALSIMVKGSDEVEYILTLTDNNEMTILYETREKKIIQL